MGLMGLSELRGTAIPALSPAMHILSGGCLLNMGSAHPQRDAETKQGLLTLGSLAGILGDLGQVSCKHVNFHVKEQKLGGRIRVWLVT